MQVKQRKTQTLKENFSLNLRYLCANSGTISQVCREIGINRHQFDRYLKGENLPAAYNFRKISSYFNVAESDLLEPADKFQKKHRQHSQHANGSPIDILATAFVDQSQRLRRYLGYYHVYVVTPSWEKKILCFLTRLSEQNGFVVANSTQRVYLRDQSVRQRARFEGLATYRGNCFYIVEREVGEEGSVVETILYPVHRQQANFLRGVTLGVASRLHLAPYASKTIWKRIGEHVSAREALQACGIYDENSRSIVPTVRDFLRSPDEKWSLRI